MTYFPSQLAMQPQVLWQPVIVHQLKDQTIEQLRRENDFLKHQLAQVLQMKQCIPNFQHQSSNISHVTDRFSMHPESQCCSTRRQSKNACYSPRFQTQTNRLSFNRSPGLRSYYSPTQPSHSRQIQYNIMDESTKLRRMVISKGKDGKYYRDVFKEIQQSEMSESQKTQNKFSTAENSVIFSGLATPTPRRSKENNEVFASTILQKATTNRLKSPSFLKKKVNQENDENDKKRTSLLNHLKEQLQICQNQPVFKRTSQIQQSRVESEQTRRQIQQQQQNTPALRSKVEDFKESRVERHECRVPTLQLSYECDSNLSIERMLRQYKRQKKSRKFTNCDHFLKEIEQNLDAMYGSDQRK